MGLPPQEPLLLPIRQLGNVIKARVHPECSPKNCIGDVPQDSWQCCAFEFADQMEQGIGPGLTSSFAEPLEGSQKEERLRVNRSPFKKKKNREYALTTQGGEPLLLAIANPTGSSIEIFPARAGESSEVLGPAFLLQTQDDGVTWVLHSTRCERCASRSRRNCGQRLLARFFHYKEPCGEGKALCMDVTLPAPLGPEHGGSVVWCSVCGDEQDEAAVASLSSRRPKWSPKQRTLALDFRGRCKMASSRNFQLEVDSQNQRADVRLLFGKVGEDEFVLDYKRPLGLVQAFAAALSTYHWH
jgi:hypothetical protein